MTATLVGTPDPTPTSLYADLVVMIRDLTESTGSTDAYERIYDLLDRFDEATRSVARAGGIEQGKVDALQDVEDRRGDIFADGVDTGAREGRERGKDEARSELLEEVTRAFGPDSDGERWVLMRMAGERVDLLDSEDWLDPCPGAMVHLWADGEPFVVLRRRDYGTAINEAKLIGVEQFLDDTAANLGLVQ